MLTLNQQIDIIKNAGLNHAQVNSFYFGHPDEINTGNNIFISGGTNSPTPLYPLIGLTLIKNTKAGKLKSTAYNFWICDLTHTDDSNRTEVLSDTDTVLCELHDQIYRSLENSYPATLNENFETEPFEHYLDDEVTGHQGELLLQQGNNRNICQIPIK